MPIIQIALLALRLISRLVGWAEKRSYIKQGEKLAFANAMARMQVNLKIHQQVMTEVEAMTIEELDDALEDEFRD